MRYPALALLFLTGLLPGQSLQSTGDTAFLASPGQIIELTLTARTSNNTPATNLEVTFAAPQNATTGEFLDGSGATTTTRTVRTTLDGIARMRYRILAPNLFATIEATALGISAPVRYALSPPIPNFNPALSLASAATTIKAAFPTYPKAQIVGPYLIPANTLIRPAVIPDGPPTRYPRVTTAPEYFYWVDLHPGSPFSHPVLYGRLALTNPTPENSLENYPPYIQTTAPNFISLSGIPGATYTRPQSTGPNTASSQNSLAPTDSCAILLRGDQDTQSDLGFQRLRDELIRQERVLPQNIYAVEDTNRFIPIATPTQFDTFIERARTSACKKLYLFVDSNANLETPGLLLKGDSTTGNLPTTYPYERLVRQLTTLGGIELQAIFAVPNGNTVAAALKGWGIRGELVTTSSDKKYGTRSAFLNEVSTAFATFNGDLKAVHAALARSLDPDTTNSLPTISDITVSGDRFLPLPQLFFEVPGTQTFTLARPLGAGTRIPFDLRLASANPALATFNPTDVSIAANQSQTSTAATALTPGLTTYTASSRNDGFTYTGLAPLQIGRFNINPNPCLTIVGGQCNITITRNLSTPTQELTLTLADPTVASLPQARLRFEAGETSKTFAITPTKKGATRLTLTPSLYFESDLSLPVIVEAPPSSTGPAPITCTFLISPTTLTSSSSGGLLSFELGAASTCVWSTSTNASWLTLPAPNTGAGAARIFIQVAPNLTAASRTATVTVSGQTVTINQSGLATSAPAITGVTNGASFQSISSTGSWVTITGFNLATTTRIWDAADFPGGTNLPTTLDDTSVTIGGLPAYVYFISPTQLNVLAPDGLTSPRVEIAVRKGSLDSNTFTADLRPLAPALFLFDAASRAYPAAVHADGVFAGRPGLYPGLTTRPAKPGDIVLLYLTGLGETTPATPASRTVATPAPTTRKPVVEIGSVNAEVLFSGKVSSGLYQLNVKIPNLPAGDHPLRVWLDGQPTGQNVLLTVQ